VVIREQEWGRFPLNNEASPYSYNVSCPGSFTPLGFDDLPFNERARFNGEDLPLEASVAASVCAQATVTDATGTFTTGAVARKNPEVGPAFPLLRSPVQDATPLKFLLAPCSRTISDEHFEMQKQRLLMEDIDVTCTEGWDQPGWIQDLVVSMRDAVEAARPANNDLVLVVGLHRDETGLNEALETALEAVVVGERHRATPRVAGAFVLDSNIQGLQTPALEPTTLWCPADIPLVDIPDASNRSCAVAPINPGLDLGPFSFGQIPILPSRAHYLDFIDEFSDAQSGEMESLTFRVPEFAASAEHVDFDTFGVATVLNGERISSEPNDAFSYCFGDDESALFVFRSPQLAAFGEGAAQLSDLPAWHNEFGETDYQLGLFWEFPFLLQLNYRVFTAGSIEVSGFSVPFGIGSPEEAFYGTELWNTESFELSSVLKQCTRFCNHPTFDSAGVYQVEAPFRESYANDCYLPAFPQFGEGGFPRDP
jgi:hypothetical protein